MHLTQTLTWESDQGDDQTAPCAFQSQLLAGELEGPTPAPHIRALSRRPTENMQEKTRARQRGTLSFAPKPVQRPGPPSILILLDKRRKRPCPCHHHSRPLSESSACPSFSPATPLTVKALSISTKGLQG